MQLLDLGCVRQGLLQLFESRATGVEGLKQRLCHVRVDFDDRRGHCDATVGLKQDALPMGLRQ